MIKLPRKIRIGHSALFRILDDLSSKLAGSSQPLELVFPAREDQYLPILDELDKLANCAAEYRPGILSIHAPPLKMESDNFPELAVRLARLAERVGASSITFHPTKRKRDNGWQELQTMAVENIHLAQKATPVAINIETLGHQRCLLTDEEIMRFDLPMVLDTTHVGWERSVEILQHYHHRIRTIHLSERTPEAMHQRIGAPSLEFARMLMDIGWTGNLVLEYWPWRSGCYCEDIAKLAEIIYE